MTHNELGALGEHYVARLLSGVGLDVERGGPADLLVEGVPLEVKAARPAPYRSGSDQGYQFCLHREGRGGLQAAAAVLLCYWKAGREPVAIPGYPWTYEGKWARWYGRWETIAEALEGCE